MMMMTTHTGQRTKDDRDDGRLVTSLKQHGVLHNKSQTPQYMMNKDVVIATIQESLLSAEREHRIKALSHMNKAATFTSLHTILIVQDVQGKQNTIKVDRNILLIIAYMVWHEKKKEEEPNVKQVIHQSVNELVPLPAD